MHDVVVGVDPSDTAHRAAVIAAELAAAYGVNLHIVTCAEISAPVDVGIGPDRIHSTWEADAATFLRGLAKELPYDKITTSVNTGDPAKVICNEAKLRDAGTIVVGNRRVQGVSRVLGSVAAHVLKQAPCNVMIANTK